MHHSHVSFQTKTLQKRLDEKVYTLVTNKSKSARDQYTYASIISIPKISIINDFNNIRLSVVFISLKEYSNFGKEI